MSLPTIVNNNRYQIHVSHELSYRVLVGSAGQKEVIKALLEHCYQTKGIAGTLLEIGDLNHYPQMICSMNLKN